MEHHNSKEEKKTIIGIIWNFRMLTVLLLGFASGLPLALTGATLQAWMKTEGVDLTVIGIFALVGLPYSLKFLWAPLLDRYTPPFLGRRRGWIFISQLFLVIFIILLGLMDPVQGPSAVAAIALMVSFFSASQDIVSDAYRVDVLKKEELGAGAAIYTNGYRIAMLVSGSVALILSDHMSWRIVYLIMALTLSLGMVASYFGPEPSEMIKPPRTIKEAVVLPFSEFFKYPGAIEVLLFILLYKLDVIFANALLTPFMLEMGFSKTDIGLVVKTTGTVATLMGTLAGGIAMIKLGMLRSLWIFGIFQALAGFSLMSLARLGHHYPMMVTAITVENFFSGMGTAAYAGFMMKICDKRFSATQFALLTSVMAFARIGVSAPTGILAKNLGWYHYYLLSIIISIPGLILLTRYKYWTQTKLNET